jgi:decaprenylphospho-beta-D-ribofuranose 2-oxidase
VADAVAASRSILARGGGCSYGDAALNDGGDILDMTGLDRVIDVDAEGLTARVQSGATLGRLLAALAPRGLTLPVVPGTRYATVGGAFAGDVHGKSHHRDGGFAAHVSSAVLCTPADGPRHVSPDADADLFWATAGGMGLTGVLAELTLRVAPLPSPWFAVDIDRTDSLEGTVAALAADDRRRHSVAWLDLLAPEPSFGRGVVTRADPWPLASDARPVWAGRHSCTAATLAGEPRLRVPDRPHTRLLHPAAVRAFNAARWRRSPRHRLAAPVAFDRFLFPLDGVGHWNRLYGPPGLVQYQFVVPEGAEDELLAAVRRFGERRLPVYLAVGKRLGPASPGPLSFPLAGWTMALDLPADAPGLAATLDEVDEIVAGCRGRVYLSKDSRLRPGLLDQMYPDIADLRRQCERVDPDGVIGSDLARRLRIRAADR